MHKEDIQNLAIQYATEGLSPEQQEIYNTWLLIASDEELQLFTEMVDQCARLSVDIAEQQEVSSGLKKSVLSKLELTESSHDPEIITIREDDQEWINLPIKGTKLLELSTRKHDGFAVSMIHVEPGSEFPEHHHHGVEMAYILEGDLEADGVMLHAGDFLRADAGTHHGKHFSPSGCRALIITANENYRHRTMKTLGAVQKLYRKIRKVLAK